MYFWSKVFTIRQCLLLITVQYILGSVVLVEFLVGGDLKFCSRHIFVSNATDSKENKFIQNRYSTGQNSFILTVPSSASPKKEFCRRIATVSYTSHLGAQPKSLHTQGTWGQNTEILLQAREEHKGIREHELSI